MRSIIKTIVLFGMLPGLLASGGAWAGMVVIDGVEPVPAVPTHVDPGMMHLFLTNNTGSDGVSLRADSMTVSPRAALHVGYSDKHIANGPVALSVTGGMTVSGRLHIGKFATPRDTGLPREATAGHSTLSVGGMLLVDGGEVRLAAGNPATDPAVRTNAFLTVAGDTVVTGGGLVHLRAQNRDMTPDSGQSPGMAVLSTTTLSVANGGVFLDDSSRLSVAGRAGGPAVRIGHGGLLRLGGGSAAAALALGTAGSGVLVEPGGVLSASGMGGTVTGNAGQSLAIAAGGVLDAGDGNITVRNFDAVEISGLYLAGYNSQSGAVSGLAAESSASNGAAVRFHAGSGVRASPALVKALGGKGALTPSNAAILTADSISMAAPATVKSALGDYSLAVSRDNATQKDVLWVPEVRNPVDGSGSAAARDRFRHNLSGVWNGDLIRGGFAENLYNLGVADVPTITPSESVGEFNRAVYESLLGGPGHPYRERPGYADQGVVELYSGAAQYGPNASFLSTLDRFTEIMTERLGSFGGGKNRLEKTALEKTSGAGSDSALAFIGGTGRFKKRFWLGGFGLRDDVSAKDGFSGYDYRAQGVAFGYDHNRGPLTWGTATSYAWGDYDDAAAAADDSSIKSYSAGAYASLRGKRGYFATAYGAYSRFETSFSDSRGGLRRGAKYDGDAWTLGVAAGKDFYPFDRLTLTPSAGFIRSHAGSDAHEEHYGGMDVMRVGDIDRHVSRAPVDLKLELDLICSDVRFLKLSANIGYSYEFDNVGLLGDVFHHGLAGALPVGVVPRTPDRHRMNLGAGVNYSSNRIDLTARYDYYRQPSADGYQARGGVGVKF